MSPVRVGVVAVGRETFDVDHGADLAAAAVQRLEALPLVELSGDATVHTEAAAAAAAVSAWAPQPEVVVILLATFTDSSFVAAVRDASPARIAGWAFPEERTGGRLRLNSLCGLELAAHLLGRLDPEGPAPAHLVADPRRGPPPDELAGILTTPPPARPPLATPADPESFDRITLARARALRARLASAHIGVIGEPPAGFEPCSVDPGLIATTLGATVESVPLGDLFSRAAAATSGRVEVLVDRVRSEMDGVDDLEPAGVRASLRLHAALSELAGEHHWDAVAPRCWPECFVDHGGACCTPLALAVGDGLAAACEADAHGALTNMALSELTGGDAFVADVVDVSAGDGAAAEEAVLWHCGAAPLSMARGRPVATVHVNRRVPVTGDFAFRPGRVTLARLSQSRGVLRLVVGSGEVLDAAQPFSGTSGVVRLDRGPRPLIETFVAEGLEHHVGFAYGDVVAEVEAFAALVNLPVVRL